VLFRSAEQNARALDRVRDDKEREAGQGYDGTWVAHPDLVPVALEAFNRALGGAKNQLDVLREDVEVTAPELLRVSVDAEITEEGLRNDISVGIQYLASWLRGVGAVGIFNLMEDTATAEIARSQVWQWIHHRKFTEEEVVRAIEEEEVRLGGEYLDASALFRRLATSADLVEFLTLAAYSLLD